MPQFEYDIMPHASLTKRASDYLALVKDYGALAESLRRKEYSTLVNDIRAEVLHKILDKTLLSPHLVAYFETYSTVGVPFKDYSEEPNHVSQVKKLVNALYHAECFLKNIENGSFYELLSWLKLLFAVRKLVFHLYEAVSLSTHLDIDLYELIKPQLNALEPVLRGCQPYFPKRELIKEYEFPDVEALLGVDRQATLSFKAGQVTGMAVSQLRPTDRYDYHFLTSLSAKIPHLIDKIRKKIASLGDVAREIELEIPADDLENLEKEADKLLAAIKKIQNRSMLNPANIIQYISIIKRLLAITNCVLYQVTQLNKTSHKSIKAWLHRVKYLIIPQLMMLADNIEEALILKPGLISQRLLDVFNEYYQAMLAKIDFVDFRHDETGCRVAYLVDDVFTEERLKPTQIRIDTCYKREIRLNQTHSAWQAFIKVLSEHRSCHLAELPSSVKQRLMAHYKLVQSYVVLKDPDLDEQVVKFLVQTPRSQDTTLRGRLKMPFIHLKNYLTVNTGYFDFNQKVLAIADDVFALIRKELNTVAFRLALNKSIVKQVKEQREQCLTDALKQQKFLHLLTLYQEDPFYFDVAPNIETKESEDFLQLYCDINNKKNNLKQAYLAYQAFIALLDKFSHAYLDEYDAPTRARLRRLYARFQPLLVNTLGKEGVLLDRQIVVLLNAPIVMHDELGKPRQLMSVNKELFKQMTQLPIQKVVSHYFEYYQRKSKELLGASFRCHQLALQQKKLEVATEKERRHYLVKAKIASQKIAEIRKTFDAYLAFLNPHVAELIKTASSGLPFPELNDELRKHTVPAQVMAIKRLKNALYYAEQAIIALEELNDKSWHATYVYKVTLFVVNIYNIYDMAMPIMHDPYLQTLQQELCVAFEFYKNKVDEVNGLDKIERTVVGKHIPITIKEEEGYKSTLHQLINILYLSPLTLRKATEPEMAIKANKSEELITADCMYHRILEVVESSNQWTRLLLNLPEVISIASFLKSRLDQLMVSSYSAVNLYLKEIKTYLFASLLEKADRLEKELALKSGTITQQLQLILDELYRGFLHSLTIEDSQKVLLATDVSFMDQRVHALQQGLHEANMNRQFAQTILEHIGTFNQAAGIWQRTKHLFGLLAYGESAATASIDLISSYRALSPQLCAYDRALVSGFISEKSDITEAHLEQVKNALIRLYSEVKYQYENFTLEIKILQSKQDYLQDVEQKLLAERKQRLSSYIEEKITKHCMVLTAKHQEIYLLEADYNASFIDAVSAVRSDILKEAIEKPEWVDKIICRRLAQVKRIHDEQKWQAYVQVNQVLSLCARAKLRWQKEATSLVCKNALIKRFEAINQLENIIEQADVPIIKRLFLLKQQVMSPIFRERLIDPLHYKPLSWAWVCDWIQRLLSVLRLSKTFEQRFVETINVPTHTQDIGIGAAEALHPHEFI